MNVLEVGLAQLRFGASLLFGARLAPRSLDRIVDGLRATLEEFGSIGAEGAELLQGPRLDPETERQMQARRFRKQAVYAARETRYYASAFERLGLDPAKLGADNIAAVPVTPKDALRSDPDAFVRRGARPALRALTTGTTGRATSVYYSRRELDSLAALTAIDSLFRGRIEPEDVVQICISSRALLAIAATTGACERIGAAAYLVGVVDPALSLAHLAEPRSVPGKKERATVLTTYPSYLGELVETGLRLGYGPDDFGLERVFLGGEVATEGLKERCQRLFGPIEIVEAYSTTEIGPMTGLACSEGHLHFQPMTGLVELQALDSAAPAAPGELASIVATPFSPFRETTVLLRFETEDVVRVPSEPPTCELAELPATSSILGKRRLAARHSGGWTLQRDVLEALEADELVPLPARYGFWPVEGGVAVEVVTGRQDAPGSRAIENRLADRGVPMRALRLVDHSTKLLRPVPVRADLREATFTAESSLAPATLRGS